MMQDCLLRTHMIPVRDDEAESQRKAKSRQARQTRRATQGVTLSELVEAKKTFSPSKLDMQSGEVCRSIEGLQRRVAEETAESNSSLMQEHLTEEHTSLESTNKHLDEQGNWNRRSASKPERSSFCITSVRGACGFAVSLHNHKMLKESECTDENENIVYGSSDAPVKQHLTDDSDFNVDWTCCLTEVPMVCLLLLIAVILTHILLMLIV